MRYLMPLAFVVLLCGCVTPTGREAVVGGAKVLQDRGEAGDAEAGAAAEALWQVAADVGAVKITEQGVIEPGQVDPAKVDTAPEASKARASRLASDRKARGMVTVFIGTFLTESLKQLPWGGTAVGLLSGLWALWRKGRVQSAATLGVKLLNEFKHYTETVKDALGKPDKETDWEALAVGAVSLLEQLKSCGTEASGACKELTALHAALKDKAA